MKISSSYHSLLIYGIKELLIWTLGVPLNSYLHCKIKYLDCVRPCNHVVIYYYLHLHSGYQEISEVLKSMVLTSAVLDRAINVETAVSLSRLELEFQVTVSQIQSFWW